MGFQKTYIILLSILSLISGGFIYLFLRKPPAVFQAVIPKNYMTAIRELSLARNLSTNTPDWVIYNLPDCLWMFSFTLAICVIWDFKLHRQSKFWLAVCFLSGIGFEILQHMSLVPGVFDWKDLIFIISGATLPLSFIFKIRIDEKNI